MKTLKHSQQESLTQYNKHNDSSDVADNLPTEFYEEQYIAITDTGLGNDLLGEDLLARQWVAVDENPLSGLLGSEFQDQILVLPDSGSVADAYDQANTYALNTDATLASDAVEQAILADEVAVQGVDVATGTPWKAIGAALTGTGVIGAVAAGGGGSDSSSDTVSEAAVDDSAVASTHDAVEQAQTATATQNETNTAASLATVATSSDASSAAVTDDDAATTTEEDVATEQTSNTDSAAEVSGDNASESVTDSAESAEQSVSSSADTTQTEEVTGSDTTTSTASAENVATENTEAALSDTVQTSATTVSDTPATTTQSNADVSALTNTSTTSSLSAEAQFIASNIPSGSSYKVVSSMSAAASAVASNSALKYVVISDGDHFALFQKGNTGGDVTATWGGSTWGADFTEYVPLSAFIATSSTNITTPLKNALAVAAKLGLGVEMPNDGQYTLTDSIKIDGTVPFLHGNGSSLSVQSTGSLAYALRLGGDTNTSNFELSDLTIDMNGLSNKFAIWGKDVSGANIHDISIVDASYTAILFRPTSVGLKNITIADSIIDLNWNVNASNNHYYGIEINNAMQKSSYTGSYALWQQYLETGTVPDTKFDVSGIKISGNQISGGYYGISFSGVSNSEISDNLITNNMRNISMQNNSSGNTVSGNYLTGQTSSAVHIAYNSDNNTVKNNTIAGDTAKMQALLQAYQDSDNNSFTGNTIEILGTNPAWGMYSGSDSSGTTFSQNIVSGNIRKTVIGVEAIWDYNSASAQGVQEAAYMSSVLPGSYAGQSGTITYNGGVGGVTGVTVSGNIIDPGYKTASVIYAGADVSTGYDGNQKIIGNISNLNVSNNVVFGTSGTDFKDVLRLHANGTSITGLTNKNNSVLNGTHVDNFSGTASKTIFYVDSEKDTLTDASSTDSDQVYSSVSYTLPEKVENLMLIGSGALNGTGNSGNNVLTGNGYINTLNGGAGHDTLIGGLGNDKLTGGAGQDVFLFNSALRSDNVDTITDFTVGTDKIGLSSVIFGNLEGNNWFASSSSAVTKDTKVYQNGTQLYYDADGSGTYFSPVEFAKLNTSDKLSITSFEIL